MAAGSPEDTRLRVLLLVSGSIAAFKAPSIVRRLREQRAAVRCAVSRAASSFVTPLSLEVTSGAPVYGDDYLTATGTGEELHLSAAAWADVVCCAPATAHLLARMALGLADDFATTMLLGFDGPLVVAPAMSGSMWSHPAVRQHVEVLRRRGVRFVGPVLGALASGDSGFGRMAEPEEIAAAVTGAGARPLAGRTVLIAAGPTREAIDPVRFLSNRSSGKMGFAVAAEAARGGARTVLVAGPVALATPPGVERHDVTSAVEMQRAVESRAAEADVVVMAAAVSDFRPTTTAAGKIKKAAGVPRLELEPTPDILAGLRSLAPRTLLVGFAAETGELEAAAVAKLRAKRADVIVANDVSRNDVGFESDDNEVTVFTTGRPPLMLSRRPKTAIARSLVALIGELLDDETRGRRGAAR